MSQSAAVNGIWFPQWAEVLPSLRLKALEQAAYRRAICEYLKFCKASRQRATVASARQFMQQLEGRRRLGVSQLVTWKAALNWFFKAGAHQLPIAGGRPATANPTRPSFFAAKVPPLAATDLGGPEWEQKLIRELRTRHYQWTTEQAYRMWAGRFARWLAARRDGVSILNAEECQIRDFLSDLATRQRVAVATQRQALNALGFLVRETFGRPLADFSQFTRARAFKRVTRVSWARNNWGRDAKDGDAVVVLWRCLLSAM